MPSPRLRVIDLETAGNGANDVCEIGWQDVVRGEDGAWQVTPSRGARFVNPGRPIGVDTMAIHHIRDEDVAGAPFWRDLAPEILRPEGGVVALAAIAPLSAALLHAAADRRHALDLHLEMRIADLAGAARFSNQMLRYLRKPAGLDHETGLPAHRALPDAYVTAHHLRDMLAVASLDTLLAWSLEPGLLPRVPAGPERGKSWEVLSTPVLEAFLTERDIDIRFSASTELRRRGVLPRRLKRRRRRNRRSASSSSSAISARARSSTAAPARPDSTEPMMTPSLTSSWRWTEFGKASRPMNRLMVKPMPQSRDTP